MEVTLGDGCVDVKKLCKGIDLIDLLFFFFQAEDGIRDVAVTGVQTCALPISQLSTTRLRFLFLAAKIWSHGGRVGVSYSDHYEERGIFQRLMDRLRSITDGANGFAPVVPTALRC